MHVTKGQLTFLTISSLLRQNDRLKQGGFTLLELTIVMVFISVLFAVSIPVFFSQIGKARESETVLKLGAMARSQQSFHFQNGRFASTINELKASDGDISSFYYNFPDPVTDLAKVKHQAIAKNPGKDQTRDYAIGIYFDNGAYGRATCRAANIGDTVNVGDLPADPCTNNGDKIQ